MDESEPLWDDDIALVRMGREDAAKRLVERLYPHVIRIIRGHRHRTDDEEDLAQEVFMKVFTKLDQFHGTQPFHHWVSRITMNTCYDKLRRHRIRKVMTYSELSVDEARFLETTGAEDHAVPAFESESDAGECARELIDKLLATLKPRESLVIRLLDLEERSVREVCALTGWGESKVKVTAHRARKKLSVTLRRLEHSPGPSRPAALTGKV